MKSFLVAGREATGMMKKWRARLHLDRKEIVVGYFRCPAAAWFAYCKAAHKAYGEFARFQ